MNARHARKSKASSAAPGRGFEPHLYRRGHRRVFLGFSTIVIGVFLPVIALGEGIARAASDTAPPGQITTIAGSGTAGSSGDGGPATSADLSSPYSTVVDAAGDVYVADTQNNRIQEIPSSSGTQWGISMTSGDVYTIAGSASGSSGSTGDGEAATSALLSSPKGLALDSAGNLYIADTGNNRIQEVASTTHTQWGISMTAGDIYTVAGSSTGSSGATGDGGAATSALLSGPVGVALDSSDNLYVADTGNNRVQEVAAYHGTQWGISMSADDIYTVAGSSSGSSGSSGDGGAATSALLDAPKSVALDPSGDLYVADTANNRVQEIAITSGTQWGISLTADDIYTVAGSSSGASGSSGDGGAATSARLDGPTGIALDSSGDLYVADAGNNRIQEVIAITGTEWGNPVTADDVYTISGSATGSSGYGGDGGKASSAIFSSPTGIAVDTTGDVFVTDGGNDRIREITPAQSAQENGVVGDVETLLGGSSSGTAGDGGEASDGLLHTPWGVTVDAAGNIYVADDANNRIQEIAGTTHAQWGVSMTAGNVYTILGSSTGSSGSSGDGGAATSALLDAPTGVALDAAGDLFVADSGNNRIQFVAATSCSSSCPWGLSSTTAGDVYTIAGSSSGTSGSSGDGGPATSALLHTPTSVALDSAGDLYVADSANERIQEVADSTGSQWGQSMTAHDIYTVAGSSSGRAGSSGDGGAATSALLHAPYGVALDPSGDLYIADNANNRIQEVADSTGTQWGQSMTADDIYTVAGSSSGSSGSSGDGGAAASAKLHGPYAVAFDSAGDLYIADDANNRVQEVADSTGSQWGQSMTADDIYTVAGSSSGSSGSSGDGGLGTSALFHGTSGVAVAPDGSVYVVDMSNNQLRAVVSTSDVPYPFVSGDIKTLVGTGSSGIAGNNGQATEDQLSYPSDVAVDEAGNVYIADTQNNRVQEFAATTHTQWGISMTAGDVYTIAGSSTGTSGSSGDGGAATSALLNSPSRVVLDPSGDLYIADKSNNRIQELAASSGTQWGQSMTADDIYTVAGSSSGSSGSSGDGGAATSALLNSPWGLALDAQGGLYIADTSNNRIQFVAASTCSSSCPWGLSSTTAGDIYTIAGSSSGSSGSSGDGGVATSALLHGPQGLALDSSGDLYIADAVNNRVQEVAATSSTEWGQSMTADDIYTVAGSSSGSSGHSGDGGAATSALLDDPLALAFDSGGDLYIADSGNNRVQELAASTGSQWGQSMTADDIYTVAGSSSGGSGYSGDGGVSTSAKLTVPMGVALDSSGDLYIADQGDSVVREVSSSAVVLGSSGPNLPGEVSGGSNPSEAIGTPPSTPGGDEAGAGVSVDSMTGELDVNVTDDSIPGRGLPLELDRTYSSTEASQLSSPFGYGWTDSYNMAVFADPYAQGVEDVAQENGSVTSFAENAAGAYVPPSRAQATLVHNGDGSWTFTSGGTTIYDFNSSGELTSESDLDGDTTDLAYTTYDGAPVLSTVTDPSGRKFTFYYEDVDGYALVSEVTDPGSRTVQYGYDSVGDLTSVTDVGSGVTYYTYDAEHRMTSVENPLGGTTSFVYNNANQAISQTDPMDRTTTWSYGEDSTNTGTTSITDPMGVVTVESFTDGELTSETDAYGTTSAATTTYGYYPNTAGLKVVTDPDGHVWRYVYDANGNLLQETNPLGATWSYAYNALNEQIAKTTPLGETTTSIYDSKGNLLSTSTPLSNGSVATTTDGYGPTSSCPDASTYDLTSVTDALDNTTSYCYDSYGDKTSVTDPSGNETTYTYNSLGEKTSMVSPRGNVVGGSPSSFTTDYSYDSYGNLTETTDPLGHSTHATYDDIGDKLTSTDQNGNETTYTYDADHELTGVALPGGSCSGTRSLCTSYTYNADGEKTSTTDANGKTTDYGYNPLGHLTSVTDPNSHETTYTYDAVGNKLTGTDPDSDETKYVYNAANELTSETEGYGTSAAVTLSFTYDPDGNETSYTDGASDETSYTYNSLDQLASVTDPMSNTTTYTYDADGRLSTETNPDSKVATSTYYANGQLEETSYSDGTTHSVSYTYNPDGEVATMTDASGTSTYTYDDADRLTSYQNGAGATVSYGYDDAGNVTSLTYPNSNSVTYHYNALEQMTSVTDWNGNETQFGYDADGDLTSITYPNDIAEAITYDNADQLSSITDTNTSTSSTVASMSYTRDDANLITAESDTGLPAAPSSFGYNALHELTSAGSSSFTYNAADDLTTAPSGNAQGFNADDEVCYQGSGSGTCGSPPSGATTYSYSYEGNRTATTPSSGTSYTYGYNEANDLTKVTPSSGSATSYDYDGNGLLQSETTGSSTTDYMWNVAGSVPLLLEDGTNYYIYGPVGTTPVEQINISSGASSYLLSDQLGSVRAITNASGTLTGTFSYDAWGNLTGSTGSATTPFGFAGAYLDPSNGLYYLRARWYDPATGQFISLDPKVSSTLEPYQYVGNDPLNGKDPTGLGGHAGSCGVLKPKQKAACEQAESIGKGSSLLNDVAKDVENFVVGGIKGVPAAAEQIATNPFVQAGAVGIACVGSAGVACGATVLAVTAVQTVKAATNHCSGAFIVGSAVVGLTGAAIAGLSQLAEFEGESALMKYVLRSLGALPDVGSTIVTGSKC